MCMRMIAECWHTLRTALLTHGALPDQADAGARRGARGAGERAGRGARGQRRDGQRQQARRRRGRAGAGARQAGESLFWHHASALTYSSTHRRAAQHPGCPIGFASRRVSALLHRALPHGACVLPEDLLLLHAFGSEHVHRQRGPGPDTGSRDTSPTSRDPATHVLLRGSSVGKGVMPGGTVRTWR